MIGDLVKRVCNLCDGKKELLLDSILQECPKCEGRGYYKVEMSMCPHCEEEVAEDEKQWVLDNYGIPYKKVCNKCYIEVLEEILNWTYDPNTGELLEEDY